MKIEKKNLNLKDFYKYRQVKISDCGFRIPSFAIGFGGQGGFWIPSFAIGFGGQGGLRIADFGFWIAEFGLRPPGCTVWTGALD